MAEDVTAPEVDPLRSPLSQLKGERPAAPAWFDHALAQAPERTTVEVEGAQIEMLAWGRRGDPGLLFLHGFAANADWWSFIAPFLAKDGYRVVASSWSGMGASDWRDAYTMDQHAREAIAIAEAGGLFDAAAAPLVVAHSYGSFVARLIAQDYGARLSGVVLVDGPLSPTARPGPGPQLGHGEHRLYPDLAFALSRFRFTPAQSCDNLFIADYIARASLKRAAKDGVQGWRWRFDGSLRAKMAYAPVERLILPAAAPIALVFGERSQLLTPERVAFARQTRPPAAPWIEVPDAGHHIMVDQPLALVAALRALFAAWPTLPD